MALSVDEIGGNTPEYSNTVREDLVQTAVKFLQNQNVAGTPLGQKQKFLQRKGLTDEEIQLACERSGAYALHEQQSRQPPPLPQRTNIPVPYNHYGQQLHLSFFDRLKEIVHNTALFSIVVYAIYQFYKKFIRPFLFGVKKKSVEESIEELDLNLKSSVHDLREGLETVRVEVDKICHGSDSSLRRQLKDLKSEIATVKGLLLSRKQFPPVSNSPVVPPSIPDWQLASQPHPDSDGDGKCEDMLEEVASGSGSSEPEHTTNKSDSSLEIICSFKEGMRDDVYHGKSKRKHKEHRDDEQ